MVVDGLAWVGAALATAAVVAVGTVLRRTTALRAEPDELARRLGALAQRVARRRLASRWWAVPVVAVPMVAALGRSTALVVRLADRWPVGLGRPRRLDRLLWAAALGAAAVPTRSGPTRSVARLRRVS